MMEHRVGAILGFVFIGLAVLVSLDFFLGSDDGEESFGVGCSLMPETDTMVAVSKALSGSFSATGLICMEKGDKILVEDISLQIAPELRLKFGCESHICMGDEKKVSVTNKELLALEKVKFRLSVFCSRPNCTLGVIEPMLGSR